VLEFRDGASSPRFTFTEAQADQIRLRLRQSDVPMIAMQEEDDTIVPPAAEAIQIRP
jgi:hypothetical protein